MPRADERQLTLLEPPPRPRRKARQGPAVQLGLLPDPAPGLPAGARLMTPRDLARRFSRHPRPHALLTPGDILARFGHPPRSGRTRLMTPQDLLRRFGSH